MHQHFVTPQEGGTLRLWHIAKAFANAGYTVTVIAGNSPQPEITITEPDGAFTLVRLPVAYTPSMDEGARILGFLKFAALATQYLLQFPRPYFIYASSTPLTVAIPALVMKVLKDIPFYLELRDMWPVVPIEMGFLKSNFKRKAAYFLEKKAYANARGIIALSPDIQNRAFEIAPDVPSIKVPNFADSNYYTPSGTQLRTGKLKVVYAGSLGLANGIDRLIDFSKRWEASLPYTHELRIYGSGPLEGQIRNWISDKPWISLLGKADRLAVRQAYQESDFSFVSFADYPSLASCSPNKFFDALAAGLPVLSNMTGWIAELIDNKDIGLSVSNDFTDFNALINDQNRSRWAANAHKLALSEFTIEESTQKILAFIKQTI